MYLGDQRNQSIRFWLLETESAVLVSKNLPDTTIQGRLVDLSGNNLPLDGVECSPGYIAMYSGRQDVGASQRANTL